MTWQNLFTRVFIRHQLESKIESALSPLIGQFSKKKKKEKYASTRTITASYRLFEGTSCTGWKNSRVTNESSTRIDKSSRSSWSPGRQKNNTANKYGYTYRRMICRSYYTTLQDACVLFDRVLTPFIFLFFFFFPPSKLSLSVERERSA